MDKDSSQSKHSNDYDKSSKFSDHSLTHNRKRRISWASDSDNDDDILKLDPIDKILTSSSNWQHNRRRYTHHNESSSSNANMHKLRLHIEDLKDSLVERSIMIRQTENLVVKREQEIAELKFQHEKDLLELEKNYTRKFHIFQQKQSDVQYENEIKVSRLQSALDDKRDMIGSLREELSISKGDLQVTRTILESVNNRNIELSAKVAELGGKLARLGGDRVSKFVQTESEWTSVCEQCGALSDAGRAVLSPTGRELDISKDLDHKKPRSTTNSLENLNDSEKAPKVIEKAQIVTEKAQKMTGKVKKVAENALNIPENTQNISEKAQRLSEGPVDTRALDQGPRTSEDCLKNPLKFIHRNSPKILDIDGTKDDNYVMVDYIESPDEQPNQLIGELKLESRTTECTQSSGHDPDPEILKSHDDAKFNDKTTSKLAEFGPKSSKDSGKFAHRVDKSPESSKSAKQVKIDFENPKKSKKIRTKSSKLETDVLLEAEISQDLFKSRLRLAESTLSDDKLTSYLIQRQKVLKEMLKNLDFDENCEEIEEKCLRIEEVGLNLGGMGLDMDGKMIDSDEICLDSAKNSARTTSGSSKMSANSANIISNSAVISSDAARNVSNSAQISSGTAKMSLNSAKIDSNSAEMSSNSAIVGTNSAKICSDSANSSPTDVKNIKNLRMVEKSSKSYKTVEENIEKIPKIVKITPNSDESNQKTSESDSKIDRNGETPHDEHQMSFNFENKNPDDVKSFFQIQKRNLPLAHKFEPIYPSSLHDRRLSIPKLPEQTQTSKLESQQNGTDPKNRIKSVQKFNISTENEITSTTSNGSSPDLNFEPKLQVTNPKPSESSIKSTSSDSNEKASISSELQDILSSMVDHEDKITSSTPIRQEIATKAARERLFIPIKPCYVNELAGDCDNIDKDKQTAIRVNVEHESDVEIVGESRDKKTEFGVSSLDVSACSGNSSGQLVIFEEFKEEISMEIQQEMDVGVAESVQVNIEGTENSQLTTNRVSDDDQTRNYLKLSQNLLLSSQSSVDKSKELEDLEETIKMLEEDPTVAEVTQNCKFVEDLSRNSPLGQNSEILKENFKDLNQNENLDGNFAQNNTKSGLKQQSLLKSLLRNPTNLLQSSILATNTKNNESYENSPQKTRRRSLEKLINQPKKLRCTQKLKNSSQNRGTNLPKNGKKNSPQKRKTKLQQNNIANSPPNKLNLSPNFSHSPQTYANSPQDLVNSPQKSVNPPQNFTNPPKSYKNPPRNFINSTNSTNSPQIFVNSPQNSINPPKKIVNSPQNSMNSPKNFRNSTENLTNSPLNLTNSPQNYKNPPRNFVNSPQDSANNSSATQHFVNSPQNSMNSPKKIVNSPQNSMNSPENFRNSTQNLTNSPLNLTNSPQNYKNPSRSCVNSPQDSANNNSATQHFVNSPQNSMNSPKKIVNSPQNSMNSPENFRNSPQNLMNSPLNLTNSPQSYKNPPRSFVNSPQDSANNNSATQHFVNSPLNLMNSPKKIVNSPQNTMNSPENFRNSPPNLMNSPLSLVNLPQKVTNTPKNSLNSPQNPKVVLPNSSDFEASRNSPQNSNFTILPPVAVNFLKNLAHLAQISTKYISPSNSSHFTENSSQRLQANSPQKLQKNSPQRLPTNSSQKLQKNSLQRLLANTPPIRSKNSPQMVAKNSPQILSKNSPQLLPTNSPQNSSKQVSLLKNSRISPQKPKISHKNSTLTENSPNIVAQSQVTPRGHVVKFPNDSSYKEFLVMRVKNSPHSKKEKLQAKKIPPRRESILKFGGKRVHPGDLGRSAKRMKLEENLRIRSQNPVKIHQTHQSYKATKTKGPQKTHDPSPSGHNSNRSPKKHSSPRKTQKTAQNLDFDMQRIQDELNMGVVSRIVQSSLQAREMSRNSEERAVQAARPVTGPTLLLRYNSLQPQAQLPPNFIRSYSHQESRPQPAPVLTEVDQRRQQIKTEISDIVKSELIVFYDLKKFESGDPKELFKGMARAITYHFYEKAPDAAPNRNAIKNYIMEIFYNYGTIRSEKQFLLDDDYEF